MQGFLYVLINPSMGALVKIGMTTRDVEQRCRELNGATGVATPFIIGFEEEVSDAPKAERLVHKLLQNKGARLNPNREFFEVSLSVAVKAINEVFLKNPDLLDLSESKQDSDEKLVDDIEAEPSTFDILFIQIQTELTTASKTRFDGVLSRTEKKALLSWREEDNSQEFERVCSKVKRKLELLVEENYYKAIPLLFEVKLGLEDYEGIGELFDKASHLKKACEVHPIKNELIAQMIGRTLLLPKRSVVPIDAYKWLEKHKLSTTAWLVDDLEVKIREISFHAKENRGHHYLDQTFDEFTAYLNSLTAGQIAYDLKNFAQDTYEYIDVAIGFKIIDDIFKNHKFSVSDKIGEEYVTAELEAFYLKIEEKFREIEPLAEMISVISNVTNLYIGSITGHVNQNRVVEEIHGFMGKHQRHWELYGIRGYLKD